MKKHRKIRILLMLLLIFAALGAGGYYLHLNAQQTPDEIAEFEKEKSETAYKENLAYALNAYEKYDFIVVLNPSHGGTDKGFENAFGIEKDITLAICEQVILLNTDPKVGIFLTRSQDVGMDDAMRLSFVEQIRPDLFIDVHLDKSSTANAYGTSVSYTTTYYNRKLSNVEFADLMEKSVVTAIEGFAIGIKDITKEESASILDSLTMPAVSIACGDMSGDKEGQLLTRENYQKNIAAGILEGIIQAEKKLTE